MVLLRRSFLLLIRENEMPLCGHVGGVMVGKSWIFQDMLLAIAFCEEGSATCVGCCLWMGEQSRTFRVRHGRLDVVPIYVATARSAISVLVSFAGRYRIHRQNAAPKAWFSHKFGGPGVRYEVGVCILTGWIVWVLGPFPCGDWPDISIFRFALKNMLEPNERVEADDGYVGEDPLHVKAPASMVHDQDEKRKIMRSRVRSRHETVNKRLKQFKCLEIFRHDVQLHGTCFRACAVLTQLEIENGHPLFSVSEYSD